MSVTQTKGIRAYQMHRALGLHFSAKVPYDYFKYNGKTSISEDSFVRSPLRWQYIGIENKYPLEHDMLRFFFQAYRVNGFDQLRNNQLSNMIRQINPFNAKTQLTFLERELTDLAERYYNQPTKLFELGTAYPILYEEVIQQRLSLINALILDVFVQASLNTDSDQCSPTWSDLVSKLNRIRPFIAMMFEGADVIASFSKCYLDHVNLKP